MFCLPVPRRCAVRLCTATQQTWLLPRGGCPEGAAGTSPALVVRLSQSREQLCCPPPVPCVGALAAAGRVATLRNADCPDGWLAVPVRTCKRAEAGPSRGSSVGTLAVRTAVRAGRPCGLRWSVRPCCRQAVAWMDRCTRSGQELSIDFPLCDCSWLCNLGASHDAVAAALNKCRV